MTVKVVAPAELLAEAEMLARTMAAHAPIAMKQNKQYARRRTEADFRACARFCESAHHAAFAAGDASAAWRRSWPKSADPPVGRLNLT